MSERHMCPICGQYEFEEYGSYDICPVCGWEDDVLPDDPTFDTGANHCSYRVAKVLWKHGKTLWDFDERNYTTEDLDNRKLTDGWADFDDDIWPDD